MATRSAKIDQKADLIWAIADKLTGVYKPHESTVYKGLHRVGI
ncbi:hypothetical protein [Hominisplanchenecus sp.]